jgi:predicted MFS family arabinose efflux permease
MFRSFLGLYRNAYAGLTRPVWYLSLVMFVNRCGTMVIPFMMVYLTQELRFSLADAGLVMAMFGAGAIFGAFLGGRLSDKIGFYPVQLWSLFLNGIMFFVLGPLHQLRHIAVCIFILSTVGLNISPTLQVVIFGMLIVTVGEMLMFPFVNTFWVARSKDHNRGQYAAVFTISFSLAHVLAPTAGSQIAHHFGFDVLWYVVTGICMVAATGFYSFGKYKIA